MATMWTSVEESSVATTMLGVPSMFEGLLQTAFLAGCEADGSANRQAALREHQAVFEDWLALPLRDKQADLLAGAANLGRSAHSIMLRWIQPRHYQELIPAGALAPQRELFAMEMEILFMMV
jgi:hypothetical protein